MDGETKALTIVLVSIVLCATCIVIASIIWG